jgi:hypothetical protein
MVGILIKVAIGLALFVGSLVGGLAATGRLNHEGTANIPVLNGFFPEPPAVEGEEGADGHAEGTHAGDDTHVAEGAHAGNEHTGTAEASGEQGPKKPSKRVTGRSVVNPEEPKSDGHGGGHGAGHGDDGHGDDAHGGGDGHGADAHGGGHAAPHGETAPQAGHRPAGHGETSHETSHETKAEDDFHKLEAAQGKTGYKPGAYFHFDGMPSGMTAEQINAAWQSVQGVLATIEQRKVALDLREKELHELADDISRRQKDLGALQLDIEQMQKALDAKIARFENTVILVKDEEVQKLKENAEIMASFESTKAAELVQQQWASERGQEEVLRLFKFMEKESVNEILAQLPNPMVQDILEKRMQVSREAKATGGRD